VTNSPVIVAMATAAAVPLGCAPDDDTARPDPRPPAERRVRSSIPEGAQLSEPVRWTAWVTGVPASEVASVRFLIDGKVAHVDRETPYRFTGRRQVLIPRVLGRGSHTLAVDARLTGGRRLTAASTATIDERNAP
jgi:hypothetical protein